MPQPPKARSRLSPERLPPSVSDRRGFTLIEVVISVFLTAVMAAAVLSMALTTRRGSGRSDRKTMCAQLTRQVSSELNRYVTAYYNHTSGWIGAMSEIPGPSGAIGAGSWAWDARGVTDSAGPGVYALAAGTHILTNGIVPARYLAAPFSANITYVVTIPANDVGGGVDGRLRSPQVTVTCNWNEPQ